MNFSFGRLDVEFSRWFGHLENCIRVAIFLLAESLHAVSSIKCDSCKCFALALWPTYLPQLDWNLVFCARIPWFWQNHMIGSGFRRWWMNLRHRLVLIHVPRDHIWRWVLYVWAYSTDLDWWCKQIRPAKWPDIFQKTNGTGWIYIYISWIFEFNQLRVIYLYRFYIQILFVNS